MARYRRRRYKRYKKRRRLMPRRAYRNSLVPLSSRGYLPNKTEIKFFDTYGSTAEILSTNSVYFCLNDMRQGPEINQRIGRKTTSKSISFRGHFYSTAVTTLAVGQVIPQIIRMVLFIDYQPNGAAINATTLFQGFSAPTAGTSPINYDLRDRIKVLRDYVFVLDPYTYSANAAWFGRQNAYKKFYKKFRMNTIYNGVNGGTIGDITSCALNVLFVGSGVGAGTGYSVDVWFRYRYYDY